LKRTIDARQDARLACTGALIVTGPNEGTRIARRITLGPTPRIAFIRMAVAVVIHTVTCLGCGRIHSALVVTAGRVIVIRVVIVVITCTQDAVSIFAG
jgi:hypothetical protein